MSQSNLSRILTERGLAAVCCFDYKPLKSILKVGGNIANMRQGEVAKDQDRGSYQRKKRVTWAMGFGDEDIGESTGRSYTYNQKKLYLAKQNINALKCKTTRYKTLPEPRSYEADAELDNKLFFFGGSVPKLADGVAVATNHAFVFSGKTKTWQQIKPMNTPRRYHVTCKLEGLLYVIGGEDDKARVLNSVECYDPKTDAWFYIKPMLDSRLGASATELDGKIVVAGGYGQSRSLPYISTDHVLSSVETYDPKFNRWSAMNDLRFPRCLGNLVNAQGKLYLCGGVTSFFGTTALTGVKSIDMYNKHLGVWEEKANLKKARHHAGCKVIGGRIYIIGGVPTEADGRSESVECYDVNKGALLKCSNSVHFPRGMFSYKVLPANH